MSSSLLSESHHPIVADIMFSPSVITIAISVILLVDGLPPVVSMSTIAYSNYWFFINVEINLKTY